VEYYFGCFWTTIENDLFWMRPKIRVVLRTDVTRSARFELKRKFFENSGPLTHLKGKGYTIETITDKSRIGGGTNY